MGKKTSKTTSTSAPPTWAVPIIQGGTQDILNNYTANQGNLGAQEAALNGATSGLLAQAQNPAMLGAGTSYINSTLANNPGLSNPANSQLTAYGNGNYLNANNAQVQALAQFAGQQAGNQINSAFSSAGRTGSGNNITDTARGVTQAELAPMLQNNQFEQGLQQQALGQLSSNYNTGIGAQSAAAGMLPSYQSSQFAGYTPYFQGMQLEGQLPYYGSQSLGTIGSLMGNYGTTTGTQPGGWGTDLLNAAAMAGSAALMHSDRRLKTNLKLLGRAKDGLGVWEWNWKSDPQGERVTGVIADEVKALRPHAYVENYRDGYDGVNYAALGSME